MKQLIHSAVSSFTSLSRVVRGAIIAGVLVVVCFGAVAFAMQSATPPTIVKTGMDTDADGALRTTQPVLVSESSSVVLLGTVISNETANIYPRRDGIVEDVTVDIGDTVQKGQVVALLLPKGVEGQSAALIGEKQVRKAQAETDLSTTEQVAQETIESMRQKVSEKETELLVAKREQESLVQKFVESEANVSQMREQAFTAVQNARQLIEWITLGSNSRSASVIETKDITPILGIHDSANTVRYDIVTDFNALYEAEKQYAAASDADRSAIIDRLFPLAIDALTVTHNLLQYTPTEPSANGVSQFSYTQLTDRLNKVISAQDMIFKSKEKLEDARNSFQTLVASEPELYQAYTNGNYSGVKSNRVRIIEEQVRTSNNNLALTQANQEQMVAMKRTQVDVAAALLQSEYAQSGNQTIRSPFTGIVSKRFVDVGQIVMPSMPVFELTSVPTSLAKKAKTEVQFGLPEHLLSALDVGDSVTFFLQNDESTPYTAEITRKSPQVDAMSHTVTVQAKVPDDIHLPHQSSVRVRLVDEKTPVYRLPSAAVKRDDNGNSIWVLDPDTEDPVQLSVSVIAEDGEFAELTGDLSAESVVILDPPDLFLTLDHD